MTFESVQLRLFYMFLIVPIICWGQVKGVVLNENNEPLPYVNIYIENTYSGTTSNELGQFEIEIPKNTTKSTLVFKFLGYQTHKEIVTAQNKSLHIVLKEENFVLNEVVVNSDYNPALEIIKKAIANREKNSSKTASLEADFYSKGIIRVKDLPKKIMSIKIGDMDGAVDSTGNGVIYLSETISKIKFEEPDHFQEKVIASKVAGDASGFSFNSASEANYNFYHNSIDLFAPLISPIANNALGYYNYKLESTFYDENAVLINKILVEAKRDKEPVFEGYIYIVENSWAIYGLDLLVKGYRVQQPILNVLRITQNFSYNNSQNIWSKNTQLMVFDAGLFGMKLSGKYTYVYSNYNYTTAFNKTTFRKEIKSFEDKANLKENTFWDSSRPVPLTSEETTNYIKKDSVYNSRTSAIYLDSIDTKNNKFKISHILTGHRHKNSFKNWEFRYKGIANLNAVRFNTVQGWVLGSGFSYATWKGKNESNSNFDSTINYGFSDKKIRADFSYFHRFNQLNYSNITFSGGRKASQFCSFEAITETVNSISTLFFKDNYIKLYNQDFLKVDYGVDVYSGLYLNGTLEYNNRSSLLNTTDYVFINSNKAYTSNDPQFPANYTSGFKQHEITLFNLNATFKFGQKYISQPDRRFNIENPKYPVINFLLKKTVTASDSNLHYTYLSSRISYNRTLNNKGDLAVQLLGGKFFNGNTISFVDYKHFIGNQTHVNLTGNYIRSFHLLPYYSHSTNQQYLETHIDHNFKGYILNKIPLLNKLQLNLIGGFHQLNINNSKPYSEFTIGIGNLGVGKFRFLRVDYIKSYQGSTYIGDGFMFGIKI